VQKLGWLLSRALDRTLSGLRWLVLPVGLLLFLQWPLRDFVQLYSRQANDLGQLLFALFVAASVTASTRAGSHLATDAIARHYSQRARRILLHLCNLLALAPWAIFILVSASPRIWSSARGLENFPDTGNPGYFVVKLSLWLMAVMILVDVVVELIAGRDETPR
jgi:TRAP-type C4-dicarboxylate transport system permease small subunit